MDIKKPLIEKYSKYALNISSIISFTIKLMEEIERYKDLKGEEKKKLVIEILEELIYKNGNDVNNLARLLSYVIPNVIDKIILGTQGKLKLNKNDCWCL